MGIGSFGAPLSARARDVAGGAVGYQRFFANTRKQLILEAGARLGLDSAVEDAFAATARWQSAVGQHMVVVVDGFVGYRETGSRTPHGGRLENEKQQPLVVLLLRRQQAESSNTRRLRP